jgi:hypothetical protein
MSRIQEAGIVPIDTGLIIPPKRDEEALIKRPKFGKGEFLSPTDCRCPIGPEWVRQRRHSMSAVDGEAVVTGADGVAVFDALQGLDVGYPHNRRIDL